MELSKLKLEKPLFYNCNIGIRFEIGPESISLWKDSDHKYINSKYFEEALTRALSIFHTVFDKDDSISITYQIYSDGRRKIRKGNYLFKQIDNLKSIANDDLLHLVGMYQTMKPKQAADIFNSMDPAFAAGFLREMNSDKAGLIMANMDPQNSYTISVIIAGRNAKYRTAESQ